jgi:fatty acid desaturase
MERRMLIGIKMHVEKNERDFSQTKDLLWFSSVIFSWILIFFSIFIERGFFRSFFIPVLFSIFWLLVVFWFNPIPFYSSILLMVILGSLLLINNKNNPQIVLLVI